MFLHMNQYLSCKILQKNGLKSNEFFGLITCLEEKSRVELEEMQYGSRERRNSTAAASTNTKLTILIFGPDWT